MSWDLTHFASVQLGGLVMLGCHVSNSRTELWKLHGFFPVWCILASLMGKSGAGSCQLIWSHKTSLTKTEVACIFKFKCRSNFFCSKNVTLIKNCASQSYRKVHNIWGWLRSGILLLLSPISSAQRKKRWSQAVDPVVWVKCQNSVIFNRISESKTMLCFSVVVL